VKNRWIPIASWTVFLAFLGWAFYGLFADLDWDTLRRAPANSIDFLQRLWPPDFKEWRVLLGSLIETIQMALVGTVLGAIASLPLAALATRRLAPSYVTVVVRLFLNVLRTVPSLIWGLLFVAAVGLGTLPGVLALAVYSAGYLTKFYYEAFESADPTTADALRTMGARGLQVFQHAVWPPARPLLLSQTIFMFEYNVRAAAILGYVGAGGIGFYLKTYFENFRYARALACLVIMLVVVVLLDLVSAWVRRRLVD
jgi:phosphonate transport system permease protein